MASRLYFASPAGREWRLLHENPNGVFVDEGALAESFIGSRTDNPVTAVGRSGQRASTDDAQVQPITGTLACTVDVVYCGGLTADEVWRMFRADWNSTSFENPGSLILAHDEEDRLVLPSRLNGSMTGPPVNPAELDVIHVNVPAIGDRGKWLKTLTGTGTVTVTNNGVGDTYLRIKWIGAGGAVVLPSGAVFTLPAVNEERVLLLDSAESYAVLTSDGMLDDPLWREIRGQVIGEGVPEGQARTYHLPDGAELEYDIGYLDPWR